MKRVHKKYGKFLQSMVIAIIGCVLMVTSIPTIGWAEEVEEGWTKLSLEELEALDVLMVTSVSKKAQKLTESPAAIYVITQEDIRRSGATCIPEALRMVPGLHVARLSIHEWAISSRGFNGMLSNKLLVLIDGRSVYTPLYAGVYWNVQDTFLEDVERIEVIRGPGATLWGANAVNGVINIITKRADDSQGWVITGGAGNEERGFGGVRYGGKIGDDAHYRVYAKYFDRDDSEDKEDEWRMFRAGFRTDWNLSADDLLTLQGDFYTGEHEAAAMLGFPLPPYMTFVQDDMPMSGGNLLARWTHNISDTSDINLQVYYDRTETESLTIDEDRDTIDVDFQHAFSLGDRHAIIWGLGYRYSQDDTDDPAFFGIGPFDPDSRHDDLFSAFIQDEITIIPDELRLTLGSKFEHNDYTGFEVQPSARALWMPREKHTVWAAASRAVRTPSRVDHDMMMVAATAPGIPPFMLIVLGNDDVDSEEVIAYELGYRTQPLENLSLDIAAFYNDYEDIISFQPGMPYFNPPFLTMPLTANNLIDGETYGVEIAADWQVTERWKLMAGYSFLEMDMDLDPMGSNPIEAERSGPQNSAHIRSYLDLPHNLELDVAAYYVDNVPATASPNFLRTDVRLGWHPTENLELSVAAQNVFDDEHKEFGADNTSTGGDIERSIYGQVTLRF